MSNKEDDKKKGIAHVNPRARMLEDEDDGPSRRVSGFTPGPPSGTMIQPSLGTQQQVRPGPYMAAVPQNKSVAVASYQKAPESAIFTWNLPTVPTLPDFHPLERTAVFVPYSRATEVAARLSNVLRDRSIEAEYDNEKAKVRCTTADGVEFRIRLYGGRGSYSHGIIVEVQRRFGSSIGFAKDTAAILDAAEGKMSPPPTLGGNIIPMVSDSDDEYEVDGAASIQMVARMFAHKGYDCQYLAFQTLLPLTDSTKMGTRTAKAVSKELLTDGNDVGANVRRLVIANKEDDTFKIRAMALNVLANAIKMVRGKIELSLREEIRPTLIEELRNAKKNPRNAQFAAQCVEYLIDGDHDVYGLASALEVAKEVGQSRYACLQKQAEKCLSKIGGSR